MMSAGQGGEWAGRRGQQLPDTVGSRQDPVLGHQGPSTGVAPLAFGVVLQGDLGRSVGTLVAERAGPLGSSAALRAGPG